MLVTAATQKVGAAVEGEAGAVGICSGESANRLVFEYAASVPFGSGKMIVTSGLSEKIPAGIPVGFVTQVVEDNIYGTRRAFVLPAGTLRGGGEVVIYK
jgi:cell shape-determining protein MreC